jgi:hypothetical protein
MKGENVKKAIKERKVRNDDRVMFRIWAFWTGPNCMDNFVDRALLDWTECLITKQTTCPERLNVCILKIFRDLAQSIQENNETVYEIYQVSFSPDPYQIIVITLCLIISC